MSPIPHSPARATVRALTALCALVASASILSMPGPAGAATRGSAASRAPAVAAERTLALMFAPHAVYRTPEPGAHATTRRVRTRGTITGERTAVPVLAQRTDAAGTRWLKVMLAGRPNGSSGWIHERDTRLTHTPWHLTVDLRARTLTVYLLGSRERVFRAVVGKPTTPTPTGQFFVQETMRMPADDPGGPFALALSARSTVFHSFDGGPGQIGIHGRDGLGGTLGDAQSHGCVRLADSAIAWLARRIGPGVPVTIRRG